jgi:hypothetical protein
VLLLRLATDMPLFIWKGLPQLKPTELAPLHHYAAAPVALLPLVLAVVIGLPAFAWYINAPPLAAQLAAVGALAAILCWLYLCWRTPLVLMKAATGCDARRVTMLGLYLPLHWLLMALMVWMIAILVVIITEPVFDFIF